MKERGRGRGREYQINGLVLDLLEADALIAAHDGRAGERSSRLDRRSIESKSNFDQKPLVRERRIYIRKSKWKTITTANK